MDGEIGSTRMRLRLHEPTFGEAEIAAVVAVMRSTMVTQGAKVREFETSFWPDAHAVACNSGSSANLLAIAALVSRGALAPGDEVIVSALSWSTTVWPLVQHGLVPVFVDCDPRTLNMDAAQLQDAFTPRTRAVMPVHVYGNPCDMNAIHGFCEQHSLILIEDCCEAMGAEYDDHPVGLFGTLGTFSFYFSHHITTLEGGMVVTHNDELSDILRIQRSHGWVRDVKDPSTFTDAHPDIDPRFLFVDTGYNLRMTEVQAAIGLCQLPKLPAIVAHRRHMHALYREALKKHEWLRIQEEQPLGESSCFGLAMTITDPRLSRADLVQLLARRGIETRPIICGNLAAQPGMQRHKHVRVGGLGNATDVMRRGFSIGCHQAITEDDVGAFADAVTEFTCRR